MKVDEVIKTAVSRAGVIRVQNALNPLLWVLSISAPVCWTAAYMFRDDPVLKYGFSALGALPIVSSIIAYFLCFFLDRDRLQSEEFILKQRELSIIERKGLPPMPLDMNETEDIQMIDADTKGIASKGAMRAHLLVFDQSQITRERMIQKLDKMPHVENWCAFFDNAICLASEKNARALSRLLRDELPILRFIITEIDPQSKGGWLPKSIWVFLNHPEPVDTTADA